jgi:hypothetical protein
MEDRSSCPTHGPNYIWRQKLSDGSLRDQCKECGLVVGLIVENQEQVNHPTHYQAGSIEAIDVIEEFALNFRVGNAVKYILRHQRKGGVRDLEKAVWYLRREIEKLTVPEK